MSGKDESERDEDNKTALEKLKDSKQGVVKCRICKEDHWTTMCPYKETLGPLQESLAKGTNEGEEEKPGGQILCSIIEIFSFINCKFGILI